MSKHIRKTEPLETLEGLLIDYEEIEPYLAEGEAKGRIWAFEQAAAYWNAEPDLIAPIPSDQDIYTLHRAMFEHIFTWAGQPRKEDKGPGGIIHVHFYEVRQQLKLRFENLNYRVAGHRADEVDIDFAAEVIAQAHHDFEYVHPFTDTNGRTGRTLDHHILWYTLGIVGPDLYTSPQIQYFPDEEYEKEYSRALKEADNQSDLSLLAAFYKDRIGVAIEEVEERVG